MRLVEVPVALAAGFAFLLAPDVARPLLGAFAGAIFVWWQVDKKRWDRRLGYAVVSFALGLVFGHAAWALQDWLGLGLPVGIQPALYCGATLASIYVATFFRSVGDGLTDNPEETAALIRGFIRRRLGARDPGPSSGVPSRTQDKENKDG